MSHRAGSALLRLLRSSPGIFSDLVSRSSGSGAASVATEWRGASQAASTAAARNAATASCQLLDSWSSDSRQEVCDLCSTDAAGVGRDSSAQPQSADVAAWPPAHCSSTLAATLEGSTACAGRASPAAVPQLLWGARAGSIVPGILPGILPSTSAQTTLQWQLAQLRTVRRKSVRLYMIACNSPCSSERH